MLSLWNLHFGNVAQDLPFGIFALDVLRGICRLVAIAWELSHGNFRIVAFAWELPRVEFLLLGSLRLGIFYVLEVSGKTSIHSAWFTFGFHGTLCVNGGGEVPESLQLICALPSIFQYPRAARMPHSSAGPLFLKLLEEQEERVECDVWVC